MEKARNNTGTTQCGYIMFEDHNNKECAIQLEGKVNLIEIRFTILSIKGDIVEVIMAMGLSWQNVGASYTKSFTERAKYGIGSQAAVNDSWLYAREYCNRLKKQATNQTNDSKHTEFLQEESRLEKYQQSRAANGRKSDAEHTNYKLSGR
eukprot:5731996-Heterocapsa_arctica.AAC.1